LLNSASLAVFKVFSLFSTTFFIQLKSTCFALGVVDFAVCGVGVAEGIAVVV
jgi:hypothetical protein